MLGYAGAVAAFFAILNYLKMHDPALKSYIMTDDLQIRDNTPLTIIIASENTTNNSFHDLKLNVHIGTGPKGLTTIRSFETTLQLGPQGAMYNHLGCLEELRNLGLIKRDTEQRVNRDSEDPIVVSVRYSYRRILFKRYISNYYFWNYKKNWWAVVYPEKKKTWQFWK